jgi:hypothetical protein
VPGCARRRHETAAALMNCGRAPITVRIFIRGPQTGLST